jgi:hypothetical protein
MPKCASTLPPANQKGGVGLECSYKVKLFASSPNGCLWHYSDSAQCPVS